MSVGDGIELFHQAYGPLLFPTRKLFQPHCRRCRLGLTHLDWCEVLVVAGNDYLGLAHHPRLTDTTRRAVSQGTGAGVSRLVSGNLTLHAALEAEIAAFKHAEAAVFFATGYMANLGAVSGLAGPGATSSSATP